MVAQEREDMHLCQQGICYSNFMADQITLSGRNVSVHRQAADNTSALRCVFSSTLLFKFVSSIS